MKRNRLAVCYGVAAGPRRLHASWLLAWCGLVLVSMGCQRLSDDYGRSDGNVGRTSLNGFGALRRSFDQAGFRSRDVSRLSDRVGMTSTIVWTPQVAVPIAGNVSEWFRDWLSQGDRTLIYVLPDSGSAAEYWSQTAGLAPPDQRLEYRRRAARELNRQWVERFNRERISFSGLFTAQPLAMKVDVLQVSSELLDLPSEPPSMITAEYQLEFLEPGEDESEDEFQWDRWLAGRAMWQVQTDDSSAAPAATPATIGTQTSPSTWVPPQQRELVLVARLTSSQWPGSQILVVNGGSLLTNYAFTRPWNRELAAMLIKASQPAGDLEKFAGFLSSDSQPIPVSNRQPDVPRATGMELLTTWPISLITMHGVLLGFIICLMLFPIFGRPRRVERPGGSHFGAHLDAVAALMKRTHGEAYARQRISEYMRRVRGETQGSWVIDPNQPVDPSTSSAEQSTDQLRFALDGTILVETKLNPHLSDRENVS